VSQRDDSSVRDDDLEADDLGVARLPHAQGTLKSGSAFSRKQSSNVSWGEQQEGKGQDALNEASPSRPQSYRAMPRSASADGLSQPADSGQRAYVATHAPVPPASAPPTQYSPAAPRARNVGSRPIDPEANRAAFDARYSRNDPYDVDAGYDERAGRGHGHRLRRDARAAYYNTADDGEMAYRSHRWHHPVRNLLLVLLALIVVLYVVICVPIDRDIAFDDATQQSLSEELSPHIPLTPYYVLLLGSDARSEDTTSRTDTMILLRVDPLLNKYTLVSIPRDTKIELAGHGTQKINAAYTYGGASAAAKAASELLGVSISHVALINFDGIQTLVDAIGGITVTVPVDVNDPTYTGLVMSAGTYEMDGQTALLFSRVRHGFALGDFQRQADQQLVIQAIIAKIRTLPITELPAVAQSMGSLLSTTMRCYSILPLLVRMSMTTPTVYQASIPSTTQTIDGVSYVVVDSSALSQMMEVVNAGGDPSTVTSGLE
jgi:LCP family protein required for cell wall assembly